LFLSCLLLQLVRMLVQAGADVNARDALDKMPPAATVLTKCREPSAVGEIVQILIGGWALWSWGVIWVCWDFTVRWVNSILQQKAS
jgi:hypothetical protein